MTKIDIISGFLGAGKTTLIKKLLQDALKGQQVVLIENEFGEIGIDGGFLKDAGIEIREMNSGCICCSLVGDFGTALKEVIDTYHPDRIVIEPSGVGKLSDVISAVENLNMGGEVVLNSAVTVVDVLKCKMYLKNFGEFFENQVEAAGTIILSRTDMDKATPEKIEAAIELLKGLNPNATIITTPVENLGGKKILDTIEGVKIDLHEDHHDYDHHHHHEHGEDCTCGCHDHHHHHHHEHGEDCTCGCHDHEHHHEHEHDNEHHHHEHGENCTCGCHDHHHHHHHADEVFASWGKETVRKYSSDEISSILKTLSEDESYGMILRAKGMLESADGVWTYFDMVPGEFEIREGSPEYTGRICVIGSKMNEEKLEELWFGQGAE